MKTLNQSKKGNKMKKISLSILITILFLTGLQFNSVLAGDRNKMPVQQQQDHLTPSLQASIANSSETQFISWGNVNYLYGNQLTPNEINSTGNNPGFAAGYYYYTLTRSGSFTTANLTFSIGGLTWGAGSSFANYIDNVSHTFSIFGIIPFGTECSDALHETIIMKIYAITGQLVKTTTFIIINPLTTNLFSNFKIFGSAASAPSIIYGCGCASRNILANNLHLYYTGSGFVGKYRISLKEVTSAGVTVPGGNTFTQAWINGPVPTTIILNTTLTGGTISGQIPSYWAYYKVTLETMGGPSSCSGSLHSAIIHLSSVPCLK